MFPVLTWTRAVLQTTPARWTALVNDLPDELLRRSPAPGEWSAWECLRHLVETDQLVFPVRVKGFLEGRDLASFNPDARPSTPGATEPHELERLFVAVRRKNLKLLESLEKEDLGRTARHEELGPVTLEQMLQEWAAHDLMHTVQAERAMMQPFLQGVGPWRPQFADHVAVK